MENDALGILSPGVLGAKPVDDHPDAPRPVTPAESDTEEGLPGAEGLPREHRARAHEAFRALRGRAKSAEERVANLEAHMQLAGWAFDEGGAPVAPQPRPEPAAYAPPPSPPQQSFAAVRELAELVGASPEMIANAIGEVFGAAAPGVLGPLADAATASQLERFRAEDEFYDAYAHDVPKFLAFLPPHIRARPDAVALAVESARGANMRAIVERARNPGRVVGYFRRPAGRFTEGAAPGNQAEPLADSFSEATLEIARRWGVTQEQLDRAAERREVSGRRSRSRRE